MAKITLFPIYTLLTIFALFWNDVNATTPRKLGVRHNAVTSLPNTNDATSDGTGHPYFTLSSSSVHSNVATPRKLGARHNAVTSLSNANEATFDGSEHQNSPISSSLAHTSVIIPKGPLVQNEATTRKLETPENPIIVTSSPNTNEAVDSHESGLYAISSSPIQTNVIIPRKQGEEKFHQLSTDANEIITREIASSFSSSNMWHPLQFEVTLRKLGVRHNAVTSLPNTNGAIARKLGKRQNPIIITSSPYTNEAVDSHESGLHFSAISSSPIQTNVIIPRKQGDDTFHQLSTDIDDTTTRTIASRSSSSNMWKPVQLEVTPRKLGVRHNAVTSLSSANDATPRKPGKRQNPIIITSSQNTNEAVDSRESVLHFLPISSSLTQTNIVIPSEPGTGHGSSIHQLSTDTDETTTHKIKNRFSSSQVLEPTRYFEGNSHN